jgi:arylformamidase
VGSGWTDLSHVYHSDIPPGRIGPELEFHLDALRTADETQGRANVQRLSFLSHQGTHVDAPCHILKGSPSIDQIPLDRFCGAGLVLSVDPGPEEITVEMLRAALEVSEPMEAGDFIFLATGFDQYFSTNDERYYEHPWLAPEAAEWLVELGATMVGIDALSLDRPTSRRAPNFRYRTHEVLLGNGVLIIENLTNLAGLIGSRVEIMALPICIQGADGAPARVVARPLRAAA